MSCGRVYFADGSDICVYWRAVGAFWATWHCPTCKIKPHIASGHSGHDGMAGSNRHRLCEVSQAQALAKRHLNWPGIAALIGFCVYFSVKKGREKIEMKALSQHSRYVWVFVCLFLFCSAGTTKLGLQCGPYLAGSQVRIQAGTDTE